MNLIAELKKMRNKGRYVVSIDYVLDSLRSIERDNRDKSEQIDLNQSNRFAELLQNARKDVI